MLVEIVEEWLDEAEQEGEQLALRRLLIRQLTRRFGFMPTYIGVRTAQASLEQLETWLVRFVDAASLQAVFSEGEDTC